MSASTIIVGHVDRVGLIQLNRPEAKNALSRTLIKELLYTLESFESDPEICAVLLTGNEKEFCVGADTKESEQSEPSPANAPKQDYLKNLNDGFLAFPKPIIGVIDGIALGGGCELAMMCDILYASETATFGLPEITLGTIPGAGGTQRLIRAIGKSNAMNMILTGETISAKEAEAAGLVTKVLPADQVLDAALETATKIASFSAPVVAMAKKAANKAEELGLKNLSSTSNSELTCACHGKRKHSALGDGDPSRKRSRPPTFEELMSMSSLSAPGASQSERLLPASLGSSIPALSDIEGLLGDPSRKRSRPSIEELMSSLSAPGASQIDRLLPPSLGSSIPGLSDIESLLGDPSRKRSRPPSIPGLSDIESLLGDPSRKRSRPPSIAAKSSAPSVSQTERPPPTSLGCAIAALSNTEGLGLDDVMLLTDFLVSNPNEAVAFAHLGQPLWRSTWAQKKLTAMRGNTQSVGPSINAEPNSEEDKMVAEP
ncbi:hypothetical protein CY34DRAFT_809982 [Suillus luteus UH-Slu-Lm8-n1]|uniref:Enoyl-CoA hydratase n=1 Tax=Suillus luteus UH-Slu-Lm8-n1 TaxID=930992 RepID=A0A0D0A860_9AGAM|nr:hypothetical protein CY34DRAFT_809982 [Suillus luteus UH-Slu-Lm8-n1]